MSQIIPLSREATMFLYRSALTIATAVTLLSACAAQTRYQGIPPGQLTDEQLVEEIASAVEGLGMTMNRTMYLLAVRPEPAYVLTSSTSTFSGTLNATYNAYTMPTGYGVTTQGQMRGAVAGSSSTQYQYTDVNAYARLGNAIATAISQRKEAAYRSRGLEVWEEYQTRVVTRRQETERLITNFFARNPSLDSRRMLVAAVAPWAAAEGATSPAATLDRTKVIIEELQRGEGLTGEWYGMFSQTTRTDQGETFAFSQFVKLELIEESGRVTGRGVLGSGEVIELDGALSGQQLTAAVANVTSAINVALTAIAASSQITGEFTGAGAGQRLTGTFVLLR
jgi:hypothetical protein